MFKRLQTKVANGGGGGISPSDIAALRLMFQSTDEAIASLPTNATAQEAKQTIDEAVIEAQRTLGYEPRAQIEYKPNFRLIGEQAPRALDTSEISRPLTNGATTPKTVSARTAGKEPAAIATQAPEITIEPLNVEAVKRLSQADGKIHIAEVTADEANEIAAAFKNQFGESVTFKPSQITRAIDGNQIRHTLNKHGDPKREAQFGGVAVTLDDIAKYPEIVKDHDFKIYSHTRRYNLPAIVYGKQINGYAIIVEEVRTGRGNIAFFDMYKHNGSLTEDMLRLMKDRTNSGKDRSPTLAPASNREGSAAPAQSETIPDRPPESQIPSWAKAKGFTALPDGRSVADRIVYYPNLSVSGLNRLLAKDKLSLADIERLRDYKWTLLFDKQAAIEKGFFVPYENGGYVPKNKFALTNIDEKLKAAGVDPAIEINNPLAKAEILRQRLIADGASEKIATEYAEALKLNEGRLNYALTSSYDDYLKNAKEQAALSNEIYKRLIDEGVTEQTAKLFANLDLDALKAWNRGKIDPVKRAKEIDAAKSQERAALGDGDYEAARDFLAANGVKDAKTPVGIPSTKRTVDGYSFYSALVDRQLANEIKRDPSFAYKRALDDAKMSEKFLSRRLANGEKELEGELNALRNDIADIEKKIAEKETAKETPKSQAAETTRTNAPETTPIREAAQPQNKDALISKYEANLAEFKRMRQEIRQTPLHERAPDWQKTHDELTSMIVDTQARINALNHKVVFDEAAKEIGDSGGFRFWLLQRQEGYKTLFAPAVGSKITFDGFNDLNFALVKNAGHYRVYNVDTGRALTGYRPKASEVIAEVKERLRRQNGRKKIEAIIDQDGVLPAREPKPKAPISATVERVNNETKHIPANFREYVRKAIIRNETKAEAALNAEIKNGQNAAFYERQKAILPEVRAILPKLKPEKVWINHNGAQREVDGLTFDFDGFNLAVYRNPEGRNALWGVLERTSGGGLFSASYKTIDEAMTTALAALRTTGRERFQSHIDSYIKDYRKTPFNPKASETKAAKAQKPVAQTKTQTPTPKAQEAIATKTKAPIAQAEDATPKTLETTQAPKPAETTAQIAKPAERSLESVLSDVEKDIEAQTLPFVKSNLQTLSQAIKANDREAIQAIASEASQSERLQGVYNRAYEALELMPKAKPKTKAKAGESETIGYDDAVEQIKNYTRKYGANRVQASPQASGAALGSTAGIEQDENGNLTYNPAKGLAGALGGYAIGSKLNNRFNKPQAVINKNPQNLTRNANSAYSNALNQNRSITDRLFGVQERGASVNKIMGGEGASGISKTPLREAKRLAKGGTSNKLIHAKTGWFKDKDGKFKFEIDDSKMAINSATLAQMKLPDPIGKEWKLSDLVKHDELYAKYPSLKDIRIFPNKESGAAYTPKKNIIKFNAHEPDIKSIMIHEIQHAVQDTEGFASGGNLQTGRLLAFKDKYASPELKRYRAARAAGKLLRMGHDSEKEIMEAAREADVDAALIREFLNSKGDKIYQAARFKPAKTTEPTLSESMAYYDRIHGETEARNVETRIGMNAAERAKSYPPSTFDQKKTFVIHNPETAQSIDNVSRDVKINNETFRNEFIKEGKLNIDKFAKNAAPFRRLEYTADNFKKEFLNNKVKTPLGIANISDRQFEKLELKERTAFFGLIKPTLNDPLFISKSGKDVYFIKPFVSEDKHIFFLSVAKDNADNLRIASNYGLSPQQVARHILNDDIIYARRQRLTNPTAPTPSRSETIPETAPKVKEGKTLKTIAGLGFTTGLAAALFNLTPANNQLRKGNNERLFNQSAI